MYLKIISQELDPANPFANDQLNRKPEVENLSTLIKNLNSPASFAINSRWGTGKSTFIGMWKAHLAQQGMCCLSFNAWATDFSSDPLIAFLGEMNQGLDDRIAKSDQTKKAWDVAKNIGGQIARRGIPVAVRIGTGGIINTDEIVEQGVMGLAEGLTRDVLEAYLEQKEAIVKFKEQLSTVFDVEESGNPIVIFVDELDRCRPDYAISLLERIKHLFDVPGLVFVLALDREQLEHSVRAIYGQGIDAEGYLRRFIDFDYSLRVPEVTSYVKSLVSVLQMAERFEKRNASERTTLEKIFSELSVWYNLSLREIEHLVARINLALLATPFNHNIYVGLLAFLTVTREKRRNVYDQYVSPSYDAEEIIEHLRGLFPGTKWLENNTCAYIEGMLLAAKTDNWGDEVPVAVSKHIEIVKSDSTTDIERGYSERVVRVATASKGYSSAINLGSVVQTIELLGRFDLPD